MDLNRIIGSIFTAKVLAMKEWEDSNQFRIAFPEFDFFYQAGFSQDKGSHCRYLK